MKYLPIKMQELLILPGGTPQKFKTPVDSFIAAYSNSHQPGQPKPPGHAISFYHCDGRWYYFDSEQAEFDFELPYFHSHVTDPMDVVNLVAYLKSKEFNSFRGLTFLPSNEAPVWIDAPPAMKYTMRGCNKLVRVYNFIETITEPQVLADLLDVHNYHQQSFARIFGMDNPDSTYHIVRRILLSRLTLLNPKMAGSYTVYHQPHDLYADDPVTVKERVTDPIFVRIRTFLRRYADMDSFDEELMENMSWSYTSEGLGLGAGKVHKVLPGQYLHVEVDPDRNVTTAVSSIPRAERSGQLSSVRAKSVGYDEIKRRISYVE